MAKNTGIPSQKAFERIFGKLGKTAVVHKLTDATEVRGRYGAGAAPKQPSDYVVTEQGTTYYAEVKSTLDPIRFAKSLIRPHQKGFAKRQVSAGGRYYFFLHKLATDEWFKVPAEVVVFDDRASLEWTDLNPYRWELSSNE